MFTECDHCRLKPGSPLLCNGCQQNREVIDKFIIQLAALDVWLQDRQPEESYESCISRHIVRAREIAVRQTGGRIALLEGLLRESKRSHYHCDDSWYCCRRCLHEDHPGKTIGPSDLCSCGADEWNKKIDEVLNGSNHIL